MHLFVTLAFLFFVGSVAGWGMELLFRKFFSEANPEHKWINPGFCMGPYLPIYGCGLCVLYLIASAESCIAMENEALKKGLLFVAMMISMTAIEYIAGIVALKTKNVRLWDYSNEWGNLQGIICPKFSVIWGMLGAVYYFAVHPYVLVAVSKFYKDFILSFFVGMFFGVFIIDFIHSAQLVEKLKKYSVENNVILRYETIKASIRRHHGETKQKYNFFLPFKSDKPISEYLREQLDTFEKLKIRKKK